MRAGTNFRAEGECRRLAAGAAPGNSFTTGRGPVRAAESDLVALGQAGRPARRASRHSPHPVVARGLEPPAAHTR